MPTRGVRPLCFLDLEAQRRGRHRESPSANSRTTHNPDLYALSSDLDRSLFLALRFCENVIVEEREPYLQFAWEDDERRSAILELVRRFAPVETIVVIGYSFPLFNRDLDQR